MMLKDNFLSILAWYQIVFGAIAFMFNMYLVEENRYTGIVDQIFIIFTLFSGFVTLSGVILLRNFKLGIFLSLIAQFFQISVFKFGNIQLSLRAGISYLIYFRNTSVFFEGKFPDLDSFFSNDMAEEFIFQINVIPLLVICILISRLNDKKVS